MPWLTYGSYRAQERNHLLELEMTQEKKTDATGRYLEKLLGATWRGSGQVLLCAINLISNHTVAYPGIIPRARRC